MQLSTTLMLNLTNGRHCHSLWVLTVSRGTKFWFSLRWRQMGWSTDELVRVVVEGIGKVGAGSAVLMKILNIKAISYALTRGNRHNVLIS